ncbi:hypothetical protein I2492_06005 [Budviciaceae bacterium CWB-B4]|uniref:Uncharacterized protein n=1 Tax=Limnobaculum xujianqingii TaxID=2738837 RepID=A0A9D7AGW0_9GAMM|nr:hypothetical protein [Limnobaculum xujianqingii]MBK5072562.1 hypothetical protein [Limnobaculum xujianqingii]MBK5175871.1 hypothetical protein [Limnobaculum xujianqingii]
MARLIQLSDYCYVAADLIAQVTATENQGVVVTLRDNQQLIAMRGYGETVWQTKDRIIKAINEASV